MGENTHKVPNFFQHFWQSMILLILQLHIKHKALEYFQ